MITFKGKISNVSISVPYSEFSSHANTDHFIFSRSRILFSEKQKQSKMYLTPMATGSLKHGMKYTFDKVYDENDNKRFQISIDKEHNGFLTLNDYNKFICNLIHNRYFITRKKDKLYEIFFSALIGFFLAMLGHSIGFNAGYKAGKSSGSFR